ncbi:MAG: hypothetical protein K9K82_11545, partial [Desulfobacteraceae bacterium]|nr:hypothetical protein [Desulfobacteraceae bacterium]
MAQPYQAPSSISYQLRHHQEKIDEANLLSASEPQALQDVMTFEAVEQRIISALRDAVIENGGQ